MTAMRPRSALLVLFVLSLVLSACSIGEKGLPSVREADDYMRDDYAQLYPFLRGLESTAPYTSWFTTATSASEPWGRKSGTGPGSSGGNYIDPYCPLLFDWAKHRAAAGTIAKTDDGGVVSPSGPDKRYNGQLGEVLFWLVGTNKDRGSGTCLTSADLAAGAREGDKLYLPVRLHLAGKEDSYWIVEGWTNPMATIQVQLRNGPGIDPGTRISNKEVDRDFLSQQRLRRLVPGTDSHRLAEILSFAHIRADDSDRRRLVWFHIDEVAPHYRELAHGNCSAAVLAFWQHGSEADDFDGTNDGEKSPIAGRGWFDDFACDDDQVQIGPVEEKKDDKIETQDDRGLFGDVAPGSAYLDSKARQPAVWRGYAMDAGDDVNQWDRLEPALYALAATAGSGSAYQAVRDAAWQFIYQDSGMDPDFDPGKDYANKDYDHDFGRYLDARTNLIPPELCGDCTAATPRMPEGVFPVLVASGTTARDATTHIYTSKDLGEANDLLPWQGDGSALDMLEPAFSEDVTLMPSLVVKGEDGWGTIEGNDFLSGDRARNVPTAWFSTADPYQTRTSGVGRQVNLSPALFSQLRITITNPVTQQGAAAYTTEWLPMSDLLAKTWNLERVNAPECSGFMDIACHLSNFIDGLIDDVYRNTVGGMLTDLSRTTSGSLIGLPQLEEFEVAGADSGGVRYRIRPEVYETIDPDDPTGLLRPSEDQAVIACRYNAAHGSGVADGVRTAPRYGRQLGPVVDDSEAAQWQVCYVPNGFYTIFEWSRFIALMLLVAISLRFFIGKMNGRDWGSLTITGYLSRMLIALAIIAFTEPILRLSALMVAQIVLVTNVVGQDITGEPYNHLWLFNAYLNPTGGGVDALGAIAGSIFVLLGLLVLAAYTFVRTALTTIVIILAPIWVVSLLSSRRPDFFLNSAATLLRLWIIPVFTIVILLAVFLAARLLGGNDLGSTSIATVLIGAATMVAIAVLPWKLSGRIMDWTKKTVRARLDLNIATSQATGLDAMVQAGLTGLDDDKLAASSNAGSTAMIAKRKADVRRPAGAKAVAATRRPGPPRGPLSSQGAKGYDKGDMLAAGAVGLAAGSYLGGRGKGQPAVGAGSVGGAFSGGSAPVSAAPSTGPAPVFVAPSTGPAPVFAAPSTGSAPGVTAAAASATNGSSAALLGKRICPGCGERVSSTAAHCPVCNRRLFRAGSAMALAAGASAPGVRGKARGAIVAGTRRAGTLARAGAAGSVRNAYRGARHEFAGELDALNGWVAPMTRGREPRLATMIPRLESATTRAAVGKADYRCPQCGGRMSPDAKACPNAGCGIEGKAIRSIGGVVTATRRVALGDGTRWCPQCGAAMATRATRCPNPDCGFAGSRGERATGGVIGTPARWTRKAGAGAGRVGRELAAASVKVSARRRAPSTQQQWDGLGNVHGRSTAGPGATPPKTPDPGSPPVP